MFVRNLERAFKKRNDLRKTFVKSIRCIIQAKFKLILYLSVSDR